MKQRVIRDIMLADPPTVSPDESLGVAGRLMLDAGQRRVPVVDEAGNVVGIITDRDLRLAADSPLLEETHAEILETLRSHAVREIMTTSVHTIEADAPIIEAAQLMRVAKVGGLPVVEYDESGNEERLVGLVTRSILLDFLILLLDELDEGGDILDGSAAPEGAQ